MAAIVNSGRGTDHAGMQLEVTTLAPRAGPPPGDLVAALAAAHPEGEWAALHAADGGSASVVAGNPLVTVEVDGQGAARLSTHGGLALPPPLHPLAALETAVQTFRFSAPHPVVGWIGFLSYELAYLLEAIGRPKREAGAWPLLRFSLYRHYLVHDAAAGSYLPVALDGRPEVAAALLDTAEARQAFAEPPALVEAPGAGEYAKMVERAKGYIGAGDIYQANLAQRWAFETQTPPHAIYRRLCARSAAPYAAYLQFRDGGEVQRHVLSASPELFVHVHGRRVVTRPIKGTRRRDLEDAQRDAALAAELMASEKDHAELAMIVDLLRNDVGRVAAYGSVAVAEARALEQHPTVWHTVATIEAQLRERAGLADLLRAMLPGGSVTGAPKIRACQIINELEQRPRHVYCGQIGVIGPQAETVTLNLGIRTILMTGARAEVYAGAGITADSDVRAEEEETHAKARAMFDALGAGAWE